MVNEIFAVEVHETWLTSALNLDSAYVINMDRRDSQTLDATTKTRIYLSVTVIITTNLLTIWL